MDATLFVEGIQFRVVGCPVPPDGGRIDTAPRLARLSVLRRAGTRKRNSRVPFFSLLVILVKELFDIVFAGRLEHSVPITVLRFAVEQDIVVNDATSTRITVGECPTPHYLVRIVVRTENLIKNRRHIVAHVWPYVDVHLPVGSKKVAKD